MEISQQRRDVGYIMEKWAGEESDWMKHMILHPPKEDDVVVALSKMTRQSPIHLLKKTRVVHDGVSQWTSAGYTTRSRTSASNRKMSELSP